jgi:hypothetical protein
MTLDEAYRKGQADMRSRIIAQWSGWITDTIGGHHRANRPGRRGYSNVAVEIRSRCRVRPLPQSDAERSSAR